MSWRNSSLVTAQVSDQLTNYIEENKLESHVVEIFEDVLETEASKDYLTIDHNSRKVHYNMAISTQQRIHLSNLISILYPARTIYSPFKGVFPLSSEQIPVVKSDLDTRGFHVFDTPLSDSICDGLIQGLEDISFHTKKSTKKIQNLTENSVSKKINGNTAWATNQQDILKLEEVQKIAFDENLLNLVGDFLGSEPILCQTNCWWSVANSTHRSNLSTNAQLFHQDTEYLKFVKVFIYLTDVNKDNGPHQYVQGTSKIAQSELGKDYKPSNRVEDKTVNEIFGEENVLTFTGQKGSVIIEDTFGLHKGTPVKEGSRLLLQLEYCNSLYFHSGYSFGKDELLSDIDALATSSPRVFSNFTKDVNELNEDKFKYFNSRSFTQKLKDKIKSYL